MDGKCLSASLNAAVVNDDGGGGNSGSGSAEDGTDDGEQKHHSSSSLGAGAVAGIVIASVFVAGLAGVVAFKAGHSKPPARSPSPRPMPSEQATGPPVLAPVAPPVPPMSPMQAPVFQEMVAVQLAPPVDFIHSLDVFLSDRNDRRMSIDAPPLVQERGAEEALLPHQIEDNSFNL